MRNRPSSMIERYGDRGRTVADVLTFKAQNECVRLGGKVDNHDDMLAATGRVLRAEPALAAVYYDDPRASEDELK